MSSISSTVARLRQVDGLGDRPGQERLAGRHHPHVTHRRERPGTHRGVEHLVVLRLADPAHRSRGRARRCSSTIASTCLRDVAELLQRPRDRLVDDLHRPAADELLELDQREVRLDAGRVAVHHETDGPGRRQHRGLGVAEAVLLPSPTTSAHASVASLCTAASTELSVRTVSLAAWCLRITRCVRVGVAGVAGVRADHRGQFGGALVRRFRSSGVVMRRGHRPAPIGVIAQAHRHQQRAEVGVADPELAVVDAWSSRSLPSGSPRSRSRCPSR